MMSTALCVTLGHNASAALVVDGQVVRAYEQERIDRKKNSSAYPREAIELAMSEVDERPQVYVGHWFDRLSLSNCKYLDLDHLYSVGGRVESISATKTHHDLHAASVASFYDDYVDGIFSDVYTFVVDGFGTRQECMSIYYRDSLIERVRGYHLSLGLMYQYATEYLGLKPNQDEYKLLGYESAVLKHVPANLVSVIRELVVDQADRHANEMMAASYTDDDADYDRLDLIDYEALSLARRRWFSRIDSWRNSYSVESSNGVRALVAFCAQTFLERCVMRFVDKWVPHRENNASPIILLAGGCHLNVKLNRTIQVHTGACVLSHPLAGDQGTALGFIPGLICADLALGERTLGHRTELPVGVHVVDQDHWVDMAADLLHHGRIVNVVRGGMEFGPRALCNTTTFALPTRENVAAINALNERDDAMPMAPVMTREAAFRLLRNEELHAIGPSSAYMITTCAFKEQPPDRLAGISHPDPLQELWTARPQVVDDEIQPHLFDLLSSTEDGVLINTSFNYHGEPIVFTEDDACKTHSMQRFRAMTTGIEPPETIIVRS